MTETHTHRTGCLANAEECAEQNVRDAGLGDLADESLSMEEWTRLNACVKAEALRYLDEGTVTCYCDAYAS